MTLHCPSHLVFGTKDHNSPLTGEIIPKNSDIDFELEIVDCNRNLTPEEKNPKRYDQPKSTTMQPDSCMYLHLVESDNTGMDLVLSTQ